MSRVEFASHLLDQLEASVRSRQLMIVGERGSGKTHTLLTLRQQIERRSRLWVAYGPLPAVSLFTPAFYAALANWLVHEGVIRHPAALSTTPPASLVDFWQQVLSVTDKTLLRRVVLLVDDANWADLGGERLAELLSTVRGFHEEWREVDLAVHFVWAGAVSPARLLEIYKGPDSASWPFERNKSLRWLPDLNVEELLAWLGALHPDAQPRLIHARYLHELTSGTVAATAKVLSQSSVRPVNCVALAEAAESIIHDQAWGSELEHMMAALSPMARESVAELLRGRFVRTRLHSELEDELLLSGLTRLDDRPDSRILRLRNWIVEATLRYQSALFSTWLGPDIFADHSELIPPTLCLNQETFAVLCEIEHLLRNLARVRLGAPKDSQHSFQGLNKEPVTYSGEIEDQLQRSSAWKKRVAGSRWVSAHSALVSYTDTKDLLGLLDHLIAQKDPVVFCLRGMRGSLEGFKAIRDAVMHGQIITEDSLDNLIEIRRQLFAWLTVSK